MPHLNQPPNYNTRHQHNNGEKQPAGRFLDSVREHFFTGEPKETSLSQEINNGIRQIGALVRDRDKRFEIIGRAHKELFDLSPGIAQNRMLTNYQVDKLSVQKTASGIRDTLEELNTTISQQTNVSNPGTKIDPRAKPLMKDWSILKQAREIYQPPSKWCGHPYGSGFFIRQDATLTREGRIKVDELLKGVSSPFMEYAIKAHLDEIVFREAERIYTIDGLTSYVSSQIAEDAIKRYGDYFILVILNGNFETLTPKDLNKLFSKTSTPKARLFFENLARSLQDQYPRFGSDTYTSKPSPPDSSDRIELNIPEMLRAASAKHPDRGVKWITDVPDEKILALAEVIAGIRKELAGQATDKKVLKELRQMMESYPDKGSYGHKILEEQAVILDILMGGSVNGKIPF